MTDDEHLWSVSLWREPYDILGAPYFDLGLLFTRMHARTHIHNAYIYPIYCIFHDWNKLRVKSEKA